MSRRAIAPGRVNLIGEHTDYTGGLVLPMAIDRYTEIHCTPDPDGVHLFSYDDPEPAHLPLVVDDPRSVEPRWARYVAAVVEQVRPRIGIHGHVSSDVPIGAGLSSSASLEVAVALALGHDGDRLELARLCQRAEHRATGVPTGIMDQLAIACGVVGHALLIDCHTLEIEPVPVPEDLEIVVIFVAQRTLEGSPYADRVAQCAAAEAVVGPLRSAHLDALDAIDDPTVRRRAEHVVTENDRVRRFADALRTNDPGTAGRLLVEGHASLRDLYDCSTPQMDAAVAELSAIRGVHGARMTGGGFGGCVVALTEPGVLTRGWVVAPVGGATVG